MTHRDVFRFLHSFFSDFFLVDLGEGVCECMSFFLNLYIKERVTTFIIPSEREVCQSMKIEQCFIGPIRFRSTIWQYDSVVVLSVSTYHVMCNVSRVVFFILLKRIFAYNLCQWKKKIAK